MPRTRPTALLSVAALLLGLLLTSGCGSSGSDLSGLSAKQLLAKATAALKKQEDVSITGKIGTTGSGTSLDLHYVGREASYGRLSPDKGSLRFERVDGKTWLQPDAAFLQAQLGASAGALTKLIGDKWILADPSNQAFGQLVAVASRDFLDSQVLAPSTAVTKGGKATVDGTKCVTLKTKTGTLYLDADTALPVQVSGTGSDAGGSGTGTAHFSYDDLKAPTPPPADQQVDLSKLLG
ncbi:MAG: hypothetical protein ACTHNS_08350 [Marmoricola sp.]